METSRSPEKKSMKPVPSSFLQEYLASMPAAYRTAFPPEEIAEHARAVLERDGARVEVRRTHSSWHPGSVALCIVAADRPGLLATISAALVLHRLDVVHAEAYTRPTAGATREALALFWVRKLDDGRSEELGPAGVAEIQTTLGLLLEGRIGLEEIVRRRGQPPRGTQSTRVRFESNHGGGLAVLEVETADRAGLLLSLAQALYTQRINITRAEVRTDHGQVLDRFVVTELDGSPIGPDRRLKIQVAVLGAIQAAPPATSHPSSPRSPWVRTAA